MRTKPVKFRAGQNPYGEPQTSGRHDDLIEDLIHRMFLELDRQLYLLEHDGRPPPFWRKAPR